MPWVTYLASGDKSILSEHYPCIKAYIADGLTHLTDYVWDKGFQYGDWCAPGVGIKEWRRRGKYVGTCYFANSVQIAAKMAAILGKTEDEKYYSLLFKNICDGYVRRFVNEDGTIKDEFQSAYVLPLYFGMAGQYRQRFANRLAQLVKDNNYHLSTGFAGTPYILFALADNGYEDDVGALGCAPPRRQRLQRLHDFIQSLRIRQRRRLFIPQGRGNRGGRGGLCPFRNKTRCWRRTDGCKRLYFNAARQNIVFVAHSRRHIYA